MGFSCKYDIASREINAGDEGVCRFILDERRGSVKAVSGEPVDVWELFDCSTDDLIRTDFRKDNLHKFIISKIFPR